MAAPTQERSKHFIPLPPLPEFYLKTTEGNAVPDCSSTSSGSIVEITAKAPTGGKKAVAAVKAKAKAKSDALPPARPHLPPAKPAPIHTAVLPDKPTILVPHSLPPVKLPLNPPPPLPPGLAKNDSTNMTYRYSHHYQHVYEPAFDSKRTKYKQAQATRIINIPPPPPGFPGFQAKVTPVGQPKLTVIHICRICMRPRSDKYHREHPILSDGVPPPPGICRRCRVTSVEEQNEYMQAVHVEESDKVKFGLAAFVPRRNLATREEAVKTIQKQNERGYAERFVQECSSDSDSEDVSERIIYRTVKRTNKSAHEPPVRQAEVSVENLATMNLMNDLNSPNLETRKTTLKANVGTGVESIPGPQTTRQTTQHLRMSDFEKVNKSAPASSSKSTTSASTTPNNSKADKQDNAKASVSVHTSVASNQSKVKATAQVATPESYGYTESEIRNFARDEVERYRQAERMMGAHPNAYAHGRLVPVVSEVPVERRIDVVQEKVEPKPWEAAAAPKHALDNTSTASRAKHTSTAITEGTDHVSTSPSEDSRHWYHVVEKAASATCSTREKGSIAQTKKSDNGYQRPERDVEVIVVKRSERPDYKEPQGLPESDPPASVKLKEVIGMVREAPPGSRQDHASSARSQRSDVVEVIEEIELPPAPPISHRVKVLRTEPIGVDQRRVRKSEPATESRETSFRTDKSYWEDDGFVRTASRHSSSHQQLEDEANMSSKTPSLKAEQGSVSSQLGEEPEKAVQMPSPRHFLPKVSSHGRSEDDSWYASRVRGFKKAQQTSERFNSSAKKQEDDEKTVWPEDDTPIRPAASERASLREDWDWEYRKRVVQAVDRHPQSDSGHGRPGKSYTDTERLFRHRRPSAPIPREREPVHQPYSTRSNRISETRGSAAPPSATVSVRSEVQKKASPPQDRGRGPYMRTSDESAHVRFASKVEFSPTPPGSDEFLPERLISHSKPSSTHSSKAQGRKSALRNQIDGGASEPPESAEELIAEYESNRAGSGHSVERREDLEYVSARGAGNTTFRSRASEAPMSGPESARSYASRGTTSQLGGGGGSSRTTARDNEPDDERRSYRSLARRSSPSGTETETATQLSRSRKLARALSESPSRERLRQDSLRAQREERIGMDPGSSEGWRDDEFSDGKGPYGEEIRTESMDALSGSGHGGPRKRVGEYVVQERW